MEGPAEIMAGISRENWGVSASLVNLFWFSCKICFEKKGVHNFLAYLSILLRVNYDMLPEKDSLLLQTSVRLLWTFSTRPWYWPHPVFCLFSPILARNLVKLSKFNKEVSLTRVISHLICDHTWFLIMFLIHCLWCLNPWPAFSKNLVRSVHEESPYPWCPLLVTVYPLTPTLCS